MVTAAPGEQSGAFGPAAAAAPKYWMAILTATSTETEPESQKTPAPTHQG